jgi:hypothetical protein
MKPMLAMYVPLEQLESTVAVPLPGGVSIRQVYGVTPPETEGAQLIVDAYTPVMETLAPTGPTTTGGFFITPAKAIRYLKPSKPPVGTTAKNLMVHVLPSTAGEGVTV